MAITYPPYPSIRIDGAVFKKPADIKWYERDTLGVLNAINKVDAGQAVLDYIQNVKAGRTVTIKPYNWAYIKKTFPKNPVQNIWNATSVPVDGTLSEDAGQSVLTEVITGPARGTSTEVYFTKWVINNPKYRKIAGIPKGGAGSLPDEILLHELVHSAAQMMGRNDFAATGDGMDYITEFRSILVTNIYATDPTNPSPRRPIRRDHHGSGIYTGTAEDFLKVGSYRKYTRDFIARLPGLAKDLALIDATFNPIQQYLKDVLAGVK